MNVTWKSATDVLRLSILQPGTVARWLVAQDFAPRVRWLALGIVATVTALLTGLGFLLTPALPEAMQALYSPLLSAAVQAVFLIVAAGLMTGLGRLAGGQGRFASALVLVVWVQAVLLAVQALQLVLLIVLPPLADLVGLLWMGLFFWLLTHAVATLHGFKSLGLVFLGVLGVMMLAGALLMPVFMQMAAQLNMGF